MLSRACALAVALLLALSLGASGVSPASAAKKPEAKYAAKTFNATNTKREAHGLRQVRENKCLRKLANKQARRMANQRRLFHQGLGRVLSRCGLTATAENVGYGFPTGGAIVRGWMGSPGHRANVLAPRYRLIGIGARRSGGVWYVAQVFGSR